VFAASSITRGNTTLAELSTGKSTGATNIHVPVILVKTDGFIQTTYFCKYPIFNDENTSINTSLCGSQECATKKAQKKELPEGNSLSYINLL
jgi:hypothetical protein